MQRIAAIVLLAGLVACSPKPEPGTGTAAGAGKTAAEAVAAATGAAPGAGTAAATPAGPANEAEMPYNKGVAAYSAGNYEAAAKFWTEAVATGDADATNNLAFLLYHGRGIAADPRRAVTLWQTAAAAGHPESQSHLADAYRDGTAIGRDAAQAYAWYRCAIESAKLRAQGVDAEIARQIGNDAKKSLDALAAGISAPDLARGKKLATEYIAKYSTLPRQK